MNTLIHLDFVAILILIVLVCLSIYAWAIFLNKIKLLLAIDRGTKIFLDKFRKSTDALAAYRESYMRMDDPSPIVKVYKVGCRELDLLLKNSETLSQGPVKTAPSKISILEVESLQKILQRTLSEEMIVLEKSLTVLATASSVGPLLGLLGTVWGIMDAFLGISRKGNASISAVAPGVAVALITTVIGLVVAIPALVAFNFFQSRFNTLALKSENFASEFISAVERKYVMR